MAKAPSQSTINLYAQTFQQVVDKVIGGPDKGKFQLANPFIDWYWSSPAPGYINSKAYDIIGQVPSWSAVGSSSPAELYLIYRAILVQGVRLVQTAEDAQALEEVETIIQSVQEGYQNNLQSRKAAWYSVYYANRPPGTPQPEYSEWNESSGWAQKLDKDRESIDRAVKTKMLLIEKQNFQYPLAVEDSELPTQSTKAKPGFAKCKSSEKSAETRWCANFFVNNGKNWVDKLIKDGGESLKIELSASKSSSAFKESWAGEAKELSDCFFAFSKYGIWHDMDLNKEDESVKVSIDIKAVTKVPVAPDSWYNASYLKYLAKKNQWNQPFTTERVFGSKDGLLPLVINGLVAGHQISFKISMSSETFQHYEKDFKESDGIRIGPFHLGGGEEGTSSDNWTKSTEGHSFSGESRSSYPFIIGFTLDTPV